MKTRCYCAYCKKHPLHGRAKDLKVPTGWRCGDYISGSEEAAADVDCLEPFSSAFVGTFDTGPEDFEWPITAYGDGEAETGVEGPGFILFGICMAEEHEERS